MNNSDMRDDAMNHETVAVPSERAERPRQKRGIALIFTLLGMIIMSLLAASLLYISNAEGLSANNYKSQAKAEYAASAGVQQAIDWFYNNYTPWLDSSSGGVLLTTGSAGYSYSGATPQYSSAAVVLGSGANFPDSTISSSFNAIRSGTIAMGNTNTTFLVDSARLVFYQTYKDMQGNTVIAERWNITATGTVPTVLSNKIVRETATIERFYIPIFKDAIRGKCEVDIGGNITTDSYYSTKGGPTGSNLYTGADAGASIGSNAFLQASGNSGVINGNAYYGDSAGTCSGGVDFNHPEIVQGQTLNTPGPTFPPITPTFAVISPAVNSCTSNPSRLSPNTSGSPYSECDPNGNDDVWICLPSGSTPQSLFINSFIINGSQDLTLKQDTANNGCTSGSTNCSTAAPCAPLKLYVNVALTLGGNGIVNTDYTPPNFSILYSGTSEADFTGCSTFSGTVYAPNASVQLKGNSTFNGAVTALSVRDLGAVTVNYDLSLAAQAGFMTPFRIVNQTRNVF